MSISKSKKIYICFLIVFIAVGTYGYYSADFIDLDKPFEMTVKWLGLPLLCASFIFTYHIAFRENKHKKLWQKLILLISILLPVSIMLLGFSTGWLLTLNTLLGKSKEQHILGKIIHVEEQKNKLGNSSYILQIYRLIENDTLNIEVPNGEFSTGQTFNRKMKVGLLGFIYDNKE